MTSPSWHSSKTQCSGWIPMPNSWMSWEVSAPTRVCSYVQVDKLRKAKITEQNNENEVKVLNKSKVSLSLLQKWVLLNKLGGWRRMSCPADTNPPHSFLTDMPGWSAEPRQRPVVLHPAQAFSHASALAVHAGPPCALTGSSGSINHAHHSPGITKSSSGPDSAMEPEHNFPVRP